MALPSSPAATMACTVLGAILSMVNFSYDAGMINQLVLSVNFFECKCNGRAYSRQGKELAATGLNALD